MHKIQTISNGKARIGAEGVWVPSKILKTSLKAVKS